MRSKFIFCTLLLLALSCASATHVDYSLVGDSSLIMTATLRGWLASDIMTETRTINFSVYAAEIPDHPLETELYLALDRLDAAATSQQSIHVDQVKGDYDIVLQVYDWFVEEVPMTDFERQVKRRTSAVLKYHLAELEKSRS